MPRVLVLRFQTQHWISDKFSGQLLIMSYFWLLVHHMGFFITFLRCSSYLVHKLCVLCSDIWTSFLEPSLKVQCYSVSKLDRHLSLLLNLAYDTHKKSGMEKITHIIFCGGRQCLPCFTGVIHSIHFVYFNLLNYSLTHCLIEYVFLIWLGNRFYSESFSAASSKFLIS